MTQQQVDEMNAQTTAEHPELVAEPVEPTSEQVAALARTAQDAYVRINELVAVLEPFAERGRNLIRKRGPALNYHGSEPVAIRDLVAAARALGLFTEEE